MAKVADQPVEIVEAPAAPEPEREYTLMELLAAQRPAEPAE